MKLHDCDILLVNVCANHANQLVMNLQVLQVKDLGNKESSHFSDDQKKNIKECLIQYRDSLGNEVKDSVFSKDKITGFTEDVIQQVL